MVLIGLVAMLPHQGMKPFNPANIELAFRPIIEYAGVIHSAKAIECMGRFSLS